MYYTINTLEYLATVAVPGMNHNQHSSSLHLHTFLLIHIN